MSHGLAELTAHARDLIGAGDLGSAQILLSDALAAVDVDPLRASADLADAAGLLARILVALGEPRSARAWATFAHTAQRRLRGPADERTVVAAATLAAVLHRVGAFAGAAHLYRDVVARLTLVDGPGSTRVLAAQADLATVEHARGECVTARRLLADAYRRHRETYGEGHPAGIKMLARLGTMERDCGNFGEAHRLFSGARDLCRDYLPADHPMAAQIAAIARAGADPDHVCRNVSPADDDFSADPAPTPEYRAPEGTPESPGHPAGSTPADLAPGRPDDGDAHPADGHIDPAPARANGSPDAHSAAAPDPAGTTPTGPARGRAHTDNGHPGLAPGLAGTSVDAYPDDAPGRDDDDGAAAPTGRAAGDADQSPGSGTRTPESTGTEATDRTVTRPAEIRAAGSTDATSGEPGGANASGGEPRRTDTTGHEPRRTDATGGESGRADATGGELGRADATGGELGRADAVIGGRVPTGSPWGTAPQRPAAASAWSSEPVREASTPAAAGPPMPPEAWTDAAEAPGQIADDYDDYDDFPPDVDDLGAAPDIDWEPRRAPAPADVSGGQGAAFSAVPPPHEHDEPLAGRYDADHLGQAPGRSGTETLPDSPDHTPDRSETLPAVPGGMPGRSGTEALSDLSRHIPDRSETGTLPDLPDHTPDRSQTEALPDFPDHTPERSEAETLPSPAAGHDADADTGRTPDSDSARLDGALAPDTHGTDAAEPGAGQRAQADEFRPGTGPVEASGAIPDETVPWRTSESPRQDRQTDDHGPLTDEAPHNDGPAYREPLPEPRTGKTPYQHAPSADSEPLTDRTPHHNRPADHEPQPDVPTINEDVWDEDGRSSEPRAAGRDEHAAPARADETEAPGVPWQGFGPAWHTPLVDRDPESWRPSIEDEPVVGPWHPPLQSGEDVEPWRAVSFYAGHELRDRGAASDRGAADAWGPDGEPWPQGQLPPPAPWQPPAARTAQSPAASPAGAWQPAGPEPEQSAGSEPEAWQSTGSQPKPWQPAGPEPERWQPDPGSEPWQPVAASPAEPWRPSAPGPSEPWPRGSQATGVPGPPPGDEGATPWTPPAQTASAPAPPAETPQRTAAGAPKSTPWASGDPADAAPHGGDARGSDTREGNARGGGDPAFGDWPLDQPPAWQPPEASGAWSSAPPPASPEQSPPVPQQARAGRYATPPTPMSSYDERADRAGEGAAPLPPAVFGDPAGPPAPPAAGTPAVARPRHPAPAESGAGTDAEASQDQRGYAQRRSPQEQQWRTPARGVRTPPPGGRYSPLAPGYGQPGQPQIKAHRRTQGDRSLTAGPAPVQQQPGMLVPTRRPVGAAPERYPERPIGKILAALIVVGLGTVVVIGGFLLTERDTGQTPPVPTPAATTPAQDGATPPPAEAPARAAGPPTDLKIEDSLSQVTLTWAYPDNAEGPVVLNGGRKGQQPQLITELPSGTERFSMNLNNPDADYCFTVAVVYSTTAVEKSAEACTTR